MNKVEALRRLEADRKTLSQQQRAVLLQGFQGDFWKILRAQMLDQLEALRFELESVQDLSRIHTIQGEIAALRVLLDWEEATKKLGHPGLGIPGL